MEAWWVDFSLHSMIVWLNLWHNLDKRARARGAQKTRNVWFLYPLFNALFVLLLSSINHLKRRLASAFFLLLEKLPRKSKPIFNYGYRIDCAVQCLFSFSNAISLIFSPFHELRRNARCRKSNYENKWLKNIWPLVVSHMHQFKYILAFLRLNRKTSIEFPTKPIISFIEWQWQFFLTICIYVRNAIRWYCRCRQRERKRNETRTP